MPDAGTELRQEHIIKIRHSRLHTVLLVANLVLLTVCTTILIFFAVKYFQVENALQDFGDQVSNSVTETPDAGLPTCEPGQWIGCTDGGG